MNFKIVACGKGQFKCENHNLCIPREKQCDTYFDCPDSSDEQKCCKDY